MPINVVSIERSGAALTINKQDGTTEILSAADIEMIQPSPLPSSTHCIVILQSKVTKEQVFGLNTKDLLDSDGNLFESKELAIEYIEGLLSQGNSYSFQSQEVTISAAGSEDVQPEDNSYIKVDAGAGATLNIVSPWAGIIHNVGANAVTITADGSALTPALSLDPSSAVIVSWDENQDAYTHIEIGGGGGTSIDLDSGKYTPSFTSVSGGFQLITLFSAMYQRVGNIVSVSIHAQVIGNNSGDISFVVSLPIASTLNSGMLSGISAANLNAEYIAAPVLLIGSNLVRVSTGIDASTSFRVTVNFTYEVA